MTYRDDPWKKFRYALESFERDLKALNYVGAFEAHEPTGGRFDRLFSDFFPSSGITPENVASLLALALSGHLTVSTFCSPCRFRTFPRFQRVPRNSQANTTHGLLKRRRSLSANFWRGLNN